MKVTQEKKIDKDDYEVDVVIKEVSPEDGFVHQNDLSTVGKGYGEFFKGKQVVKSYTINNPKIVQYVTLGILVVLLILNIVFFILHIFAGLIFLGVFTIPFIVIECKRHKKGTLEKTKTLNNEENND